MIYLQGPLKLRALTFWAFPPQERTREGDNDG